MFLKPKQTRNKGFEGGNCPRFAPSRLLRRKAGFRLGGQNLSQERSCGKAMEDKKVQEIKKQEENLKFIDSLLYNNERRNKPTVNKYDAREDIFKFMIAKEKILSSLHDIKTKSVVNTKLNSNGFQYSLNEENIAQNIQDIHPPIGKVEEEIIGMFHFRENLLQKAPGNFSLSSTHHDIRFEKTTPHNPLATNDHFYFPKKKEHSSTKRPISKGSFCGKKVRHPCFRNAASRRYRNRSKVPKSMKIEYTKKIDRTDMNNTSEISKVFKDKFLNFIDPVRTKDLNFLSTPNSPSLKSRRKLENLKSRSVRRPGTMGKVNGVSYMSSNRASNFEMPKKSQKINLSTYSNFRSNIEQPKEVPNLENDEDMKNIPQHLFNFMRNASKELLKNNSELNSQDDSNEIESQESSEPVITIQKRYGNPS
ncbi:unnamed protein product [Moneuplotes crassus]|uniref:Uncharacterized protein n=1 Tax=Euplotes crassus TaxID=5936 RepID=A0AAD1UI12_EUPCR|nr:unnamed protein product [Moneuplotes crassus]